VLEGRNGASHAREFGDRRFGPKKFSSTVSRPVGETRVFGGYEMKGASSERNGASHAREFGDRRFGPKKFSSTVNRPVGDTRVLGGYEIKGASSGENREAGQRRVLGRNGTASRER